MTVKHRNNGRCEKCHEIIEKYPNPNPKLKSWFILFQARHPETHVSCFGRGYEEQEAAFKSGASRAHFGESAHNFNCALDLFVMDFAKHPNDLYPKKWFDETLAPEIPFFLNWYGAPGSPFPELPHVEIREFRALIVQGLAQLVEPHPKKDNVA